MPNRPFKTESLLALSLAATSLFCVGTAAKAQTTPAPTDRTVRDDNDATRRNLEQFDRFLDSHPEIAEQVRKDPSLADNKNFLKNHPALQTFLQDQPAIRQDLRQNPNAFMHQDDAFDRRDNDFDRDAVNRRNREQFNQFLDSHREVSEQLRKDPAQADNEQYLKAHPELQAFLQDHPEIRQDLRDNPNAYIREQDAFDRRDGQSTRAQEQRADFDRFLDNHPETAEQLRKDPSLADNEEFLKTHPALQTYLREQPAVRQDLRNDPNAFVHQADAFNRSDYGRDRDLNADQRASFRDFLGGHSTISDQLSRDPSLVKNHDYVQNHPELQAYLSSHPDVRDYLMQNPEQLSNTTPVKPSSTTATPAPATTPAPAPKSVPAPNPAPAPSPEPNHNAGSKY